MEYQNFERRWQKSGGAERANYGLFLQDFCDLIGVPRPEPMTDNPAQDAYVLERGVTFDDGGGKQSTGRIDLYKRGCFVLETKQGTNSPDEQRAAEKAQLGLPVEKRRKGHAQRGTAKWEQMMKAAQEQALRYVRALPASEPHPPFVVVVDVGYCVDLYSNFTGIGDTYVPFPDAATSRLYLPALSKPELRQQLHQLFTDPQQLDPARRAAQVTRQLAGYLAGLSSQLEKAGHASEVVAQFLMRCLFTMFAEDVQLIPTDSFKGLLAAYSHSEESRGLLPQALQALWAVMDKGGFSAELRTNLRRFNGQLFHNATALPLNADQVQLLQLAAAANWTEVEPTIFGTLLERALDPAERHSLGAHYTPRRYVERLVLPTVIDPLRREWAAAQAASATRHNEGKDKEARSELVKFLNRLTSVKILDPACGSGNFLYVTLEHLKRLEGEVLTAINSFGQTGLLDLAGTTTVGPRQLLGLELNPRAAAIADVVLRIGYLQWHIRTYGLSEMPQPLLTDDHNIQQQDAALHHGPPVPRLDAQGQPVTRWDGTTRPHPVTGLPVPDENARVVVLDYPDPRPAEWPQADFIIGNPPFIGASRLRDALGEGYADALQKAYKKVVPASADFVMYWWHKAAQAVQAGTTERFGFITTNSLKQTFNRRVMQPFLEGDTPPLTLTFAIPDHPWVDSGDGAAVRIALTVAERSRAVAEPGMLLAVQSETVPEGDDAANVTFIAQMGRIQPDLSIGADLDTARPLKANNGLTSRGIQLYGAGFILSKEDAVQLQTIYPGSQSVIRPYLNGKDFTGNSRGVLVIDLYGLSNSESLARYPLLYQRLVERVKPERNMSKEPRVKDNWWLHGRTRDEMRQALVGLPCYIATVETAKHRVFQLLESSILPDNKLIVFALDDAYQLGVLSSRIHVVWATAAGSWLGVGNDSVYAKTRCFDPFPFPAASPAQQARIRELAETIDAHRKRQQAQHSALTLTNLYNVVEQLRAGQPLTPKQHEINQQGLASLLLSLHQDLDAAVSAAYGWPTTLPDAELLTRIVQLNHARAAEENAGTVRYLRPEYQAPGQQAALFLPATATMARVSTTSTAQPWPAELAHQLLAVRGIIQQAGGVALSSDEVASRFRRTKPEKIKPLLDTLAIMSLVRYVEAQGTYAV